MPAQNIFEKRLNRACTGVMIAGLGWNIFFMVPDNCSEISRLFSRLHAFIATGSSALTR
jgi:hypothetical protein